MITNKSYKKISIILAFLLIFNILLNNNISYADSYQEQLDKGLVELYSDTSITLRAGETYYIALQGGKGGSGGSGLDINIEKNRYTTRGGNLGSNGTTNYYEVIVESDTIISLYRGNNGSTGDSAPYTVNGDYPDRIAKGGNGGKNALNLGSGLSGEDGKESRCNVGLANGDRIRYHSAAGGGGGAASIITFNGDINNRITAKGGSGGSGAVTEFKKEDGKRYYKTNDNPGSGGSGGSVSQNYSNIPGVTVKQLTAAEGSAKVKVPTKSGAIIRKQRKDTGRAIPVNDLMSGEHIVLTNSIDNAATIFRKTSNDLEFEYFSGAHAYYDGGTTRYLDWHSFSKYAVSGNTGSGSNMKIIVKPDLVFVGGDGTATRPYYPEPAGSISNGGGSGNSGGINPDNYEDLINSIISVSSMIENLNNTIINNNQKNNNNEFIPFTLELKPVNGAYATKKDNIDIHLKANGRRINELSYMVSVNGTQDEELQSVPITGIINIKGLDSGHNTIVVTVMDLEGNTQTEIINIWRL